jgi:transposase
MKKPAKLKPWLSVEELMVWVQEATSREDYQRRLAVWLTHIGPYYAQEIATMLQVSVQAVWLWVGQYNTQGPGGLQRQGRGGRRWGFLTWQEEQRLLERLATRASQGQLLTAKQMYREVCETVGKEVSVDYVYRLLHRHTWKKMGPRPRHVKANPADQEAFKKNSPGC